jgi:hypothetical protein
MLHDKDPSVLKDPERLAYAEILQPFTGNGDVSIYTVSEKFLSERDKQYLMR